MYSQIQNQNYSKSLLILTLLEDINHYKTTIELKKNKSDIISILDELALTMETLGRNLIYDEELNSILNKEELELIQYSGLFQNNKLEKYWEFQHNNFQEYLAAKLLSNYNLEIIKNFISFPSDHNNNNSILGQYIILFIIFVQKR